MSVCGELAQATGMLGYFRDAGPQLDHQVQEKLALLPGKYEEVLKRHFGIGVGNQNEPVSADPKNCDNAVDLDVALRLLRRPTLVIH